MHKIWSFHRELWAGCLCDSGMAQRYQLMLPMFFSVSFDFFEIIGESTYSPFCFYFFPIKSSFKSIEREVRYIYLCGLLVGFASQRQLEYPTLSFSLVSFSSFSLYTFLAARGMKNH